MYFSRSRSKKFSDDVLAKLGLTEDVAVFYKREAVRECVASAYLELKNKVDELVERIPDCYPNAIDVDGLEELFTKEVKYDFEKTLALYLRCSESRGEINDEFLKKQKYELRNSDSKLLRDLKGCAKRVEEDLVSWYQYIVRIHTRSSYYYDDDDDSNEVEIYD